MSIPYSDLPSAATMKNLSENSDDQWLFLQASTTLFATVTTFLVILFMLPMVLAAPIGMICGTTFWSGDLIAVQAWIQSALLCAVTSAAVLVMAASCLRIYTRSQFGSPAHYAEIQVDMSHEETRKLIRSYLRAMSVDETFAVDRSERRQVALMQESRFSNTFLEVSTLSLDRERTLITFRSASKVNGKAILISSFFTDFGSSKEGVLKMMKIFSPYSSRQKRPRAGYVQSRQAMAVVKITDLAPPPTMRLPRYQHEVCEADRIQLKACG